MVASAAFVFLGVFGVCKKIVITLKVGGVSLDAVFQCFEFAAEGGKDCGALYGVFHGSCFSIGCFVLFLVLKCSPFVGYGFILLQFFQ